jgi:hypothetical protein
MNINNIRRPSDHEIKGKNGFKRAPERENILITALLSCQRIKYILSTTLFTADPYTKSVLFCFN